MPDSNVFCSARAYFPRGLVQPEGSFRFSADALLLAAFTVRHCLPAFGPASFLDLGCGCGVVGLACLLAVPELTSTGIDVNPDLVAATRTNAASLGLEDRYTTKILDLISNKDTGWIPPGGFDAVAANMPFRLSGAGRIPRSESRACALVANEFTIPAFLGSAKDALAPNGRLALIYPLNDLERMLSALDRFGFSPLSLLPVISTRADSARILIAATHKQNQNFVPRHEPPLFLYSSPGGAYTEEALSFCPWMAPRPWSSTPSQDYSATTPDMRT